MGFSFDLYFVLWNGEMDAEERVFYILDFREWKVPESTKAVGKLGENEHEMRFHNLCKEMEEEQQCNKMDLREW